MHEIESFAVGDLTVRIFPDEDPENPREWSNLGTMVCWHRRAALGDKHSFRDTEALLLDIIEDAKVETRLENAFNRQEARLCAGLRIGSDEYLCATRECISEYNARLMAEAEKKAIILPLYLYEHGGMTMSTGAFSDPWDSGQVGWVFVTLADVRREYGCKRVSAKQRARVEAALEAEVGVFDEWLSNNVYAYVVETETGDEVDSCLGLFGLAYARSEATAAAKRALLPAPA